jgi:hypothetical protein
MQWKVGSADESLHVDICSFGGLSWRRLWFIRRNARFYDLLALTSCDCAGSPKSARPLLQVEPHGESDMSFESLTSWLETTCRCLGVTLYVTVGSMKWVHKLVNWKFEVRRRVLSGDGGYFRLRAPPFVRCLECSWYCARSGHSSTGRLHDRSSSTIDSSMSLWLVVLEN